MRSCQWVYDYLRKEVKHTIISAILNGDYVCMYLCMHVCMYVCLFVYMFVCAYGSICVYIYMCVNACMCVCVYVFMCACTHIPLLQYAGLKASYST